MPELITMPIKPLKCRRCDSEVARTNGLDLFVEGKPIPLSPTRVQFPCVSCGLAIKWNSSRERRGTVEISR